MLASGLPILMYAVLFASQDPPPSACPLRRASVDPATVDAWRSCAFVRALITCSVASSISLPVSKPVFTGSYRVLVLPNLSRYTWDVYTKLIHTTEMMRGMGILDIDQGEHEGGSARSSWSRLASRLIYRDIRHWG